MNTLIAYITTRKGVNDSEIRACDSCLCHRGLISPRHVRLSVMRPHCFNQMTDPRPNRFIPHDFSQIAMLAHLRLQATVLRQIGRREIRC
jgi:hypothetical protein